MSTADFHSTLVEADLLLSTEPASALSLAESLLQTAPADPDVLRILGVAQRKCHRLQASSETLAGLARIAPDFALAHEELGFTLLAGSDGPAALKAFKQAVSSDRSLGNSWKALGDLISLEGDELEAQKCYQEYLSCTAGSPELAEAATYLQQGKLAKCEKICREFLF